MTLANKILLGAGAAAGLTILTAFVWLSLANAHLAAQLAQERAKSAACLVANDTFADQVSRQDKAVQQMRVDSEQREKQALETAAKTQQKARALFAAAEKLQKMKTSGDACKSADAIFNMYLESGK